MALVARTTAPRPKSHGRVVEVHQRHGFLKPTDVYDLRIIIWAPKFGAHSHTLVGIKGKTTAYDIAERVGKAPVQEVKR